MYGVYYSGLLLFFGILKQKNSAINIFPTYYYIYE